MSTTVMYQEGGSGSYTPTTFDDCYITEGSDATGNSWDACVRNGSGTHMYGPLAVKNLFTLLPQTSGGSTLSISSAQLILTTYQATTTDTLYVDRLTSNWLPNAAGANETNVSYKHKSLSPSQFWAGGGDISASDYTTTNEATVLWAASNNTNTVDITALLKDIYTAGINDGFLIRSSNTGGGDTYYTSEYSTQTSRPVLKITYDYIPAVTITATQPNAAEPSTTGTYTVTRTGTGSALTVNYTVSGTATNGTDYTSLTGSVTIPSGQASATITLTPTNDNIVESTETAILTLAAGTGYTVGSPSAATVNITDNDSTVSITATQPNAAEPSTNGTFTVTRAGYTGAAVTVNYSVTGTATNGTDYTSLTGAVTIASGQTTATITVAVIDDAAVEGTETAILTLTSGTDYTVGSPNNATVNIADNDSGSFGITGVTGMVNTNQPLTITGNVFGSGPSNVLFDNFDNGVVGNAINTGPGSTTVGSGWSDKWGWTSYSTAHVISGKQAFEGDNSNPGANCAYYNLPAGTNQVYASFCLRIPDKMPGWDDTVNDINYKFLWLQGAGHSFTTDDTAVVFLGTNKDGSNSIENGGNCLDGYPGTTTWTGWSEGTAYNAGDWVRFTYSVTGDTANGHRTLTLLDLTTGVNYTPVTYTGRTWAKGSPDEWRSIEFNAYAARSDGTASWLDDAYCSTGANAASRVEIGNASTYAACTNLSTCPTTSWANGSITALTELGSLNPAGPLYLYVTTSDGVTSTTSAGYAITASQAPAAVTDSYIASNGALTTTAATGVIANDVDLQGGTITASKVANPSHGSVTLNSDGSFTYTPTVGYYGPDSFTYQDSDGTHTGNTGTVNIDVRQLFVDFGGTSDTFGTSWNNPSDVFKNQWVSRSADGPGGMLAQSYGKDSFAGIKDTTARTFNAGETIYVTWYNDSTTLLPSGNVTFTPQISFDDTDGDGDGMSGTWYNMTPIDNINPHTSVTSSYTFTTAGSYKLINVCSVTSNLTGLMFDKIEID